MAVNYTHHEKVEISKPNLGVLLITDISIALHVWVIHVQTVHGSYIINC